MRATTRRRSGGAALALTTALAIAACSPVGHEDAASARPSWSVVGYAEAGGTSDARLARSTAVTTVGVDGVNVTADGAGVTPVSAEALHLLRRAHAAHRDAELLVGNFDGDLGDFSPAIGDALLGSRAHVDAVVAALRQEVVRHGWDGVTVDLESLTDRHPAGLTRLVSRLKTALGPHRSVSICLMATTDHYADLGYDLRALGRASDHVVLMAYDQHGSTWTAAGPVGGTPWVRASLAPLLRAVPHGRIQLGVAGYGYSWPERGTGGQLSDAQARATASRAGARPVWDSRQQEWHAATPAGTTLWWSDRRTLQARVSLARRLGLGGVAIWSVGLSDPITTAR